MEGFEVTAKRWGRCGLCQVVAFTVRGRAPINKHVCWAVRQAWPVTVERRYTPREIAAIPEPEDVDLWDKGSATSWCVSCAGSMEVGS